jgi:uncharacterized protein with HEPN domain
MKTTRDYLLDIQKEVTRIEAFTLGGRDAFLRDERTQYAVMMAYARIGEIAKRLPEETLQNYPDAEWRSIKGFRDMLIHRYDMVIPLRIWDAIEKLPVLKSAIESMLLQSYGED